MNPDLSVVVPTLNETQAILTLLQSLARQQDIRVEVVVVDGGSTDGTLEQVRLASAYLGLLCATVSAPRGRARQMNRGVDTARSGDLLFLHADSQLADCGLLAAAKERMATARAGAGGDRVAGHFGIRFHRSVPGPSAAYYFYAAKTRLNRPDCVNGDQGFWLSRRYFEELGRFDETLPFMEDARLAARIFETGSWVTLPGEIETSARRFEAEGLRERQTLNALLCNFHHIGLSEFFERSADAYRGQDRVGRLELLPFFRLAHQLARARGAGGFLTLWRQTGAYVAANAWQLAFALDCAGNRRRGLAPGAGATPWVDRYDQWLAPLVTSPPARLVTALLTAAWFYSRLARGR